MSGIPEPSTETGPETKPARPSQDSPEKVPVNPGALGTLDSPSGNPARSPAASLHDPIQTRGYIKAHAAEESFTRQPDLAE